MSGSVIHPTAIVDPGAEIGANVQIGPSCIIGPGVVLGDGNVLQHHVTICGPSQIGPRNRFYAYCSIGQQTQDLKYAGEPTHLVVGENNCFREFVTIHRGTAIGAMTRVGSHGNFLAYSHIAHDCTVGDHVIFSNNGTLAGHVTVEDHAVIGGLTAIHQFCRVGCHAITGGCSKIVQDVPPLHDRRWQPRCRARHQPGGPGTPRLYARDDPPDQGSLPHPLPLQAEHPPGGRAAKESEAQSPEIEHLISFIESSQRGIIR
ncbi:MAG: acyl-ACP--UDP-N-acetylglucosamine O-acyltransferase [Chthoniobacteraceae bacterium]